MIPPVPTRDLQEAFTSFVKECVVPSSLPSPDSIKIRSAIVDYGSLTCLWLRRKSAPVIGEAISHYRIIEKRTFSNLIAEPQ